MGPASRLAIAMVLAAPAGATAAPVGSIAVGTRDRGAMLSRLRGQRARVTGDRLIIDDIAGEGRPWIGVVERRGDQLWLVGEGFALRLLGPLARPRLAGPGYTVWVVGDRRRAGAALVARRLGVLAPPAGD
jgi:hypothetical protein